MFWGIFFYIATCLVMMVESEYIKCPLVWKGMNTGDPIMKEAVPAALFGKTNYVARARMENGSYALGRWQNGTVFTVFEGEVQQNTTYEVLTNPHDCDLNWAPKTTTDHTIPTSDEEKNTCVGRLLSDDILLSGQVDNDTINFVTISLEVGTKSDFEVLQSYSLGLSLSVTNFVFTNNPFNSVPDVLGFDEISNNSPATVRQSVYHKKRILQESKVTTTQKWGRVSNVKLGVKAKITASACGISEDYSLQKNLFSKDFLVSNNTKIDEVFDAEEVVIESRREISVPPFSSIQFCSAVTLYEDFYATYEAQGVYSAPGLTGEEVGHILEADGLRGVRDGNSVIVRRYGTFSGTMAMSTEFITSPSGVLGGCMQLSYLVDKLKRDRAFGRIKSREEYNQRLLEVNGQFGRLVKRPCSGNNSTTTTTSPITQSLD